MRQFQRLQTKAKVKKGHLAMSYASKPNWNISKDAERVLCTIAEGLIEKCKREGRIPQRYRFWHKTDMPELLEELRSKAIIRHFTHDAKLGEIFELDVDQKLMASILGWDQN